LTRQPGGEWAAGRGRELGVGLLILARGHGVAQVERNADARQDGEEESAQVGCRIPESVKTVCGKNPTRLLARSGTRPATEG
jgi:hypothetical protein